jgi:hypothetical protein
LPKLSEKQILVWADAYFALHGKWPGEDSGPVAGTQESWPAIIHAMRNGHRGFPRGSSLAELLARRRGARSSAYLPPLTERQILVWADAFFAAQGRWPTRHSGPIANTEETWSAVASALESGSRGLRGGSSLAQLLARQRGMPNRMRLPRLSERTILAWADAHFAVHKEWPGRESGAVSGTSEAWDRIDTVLRIGARGLRGGSSLAQLLARRRGVRNIASLPPLNEQWILAWAKAHFEATGRWPRRESGPIAQAPAETWLVVDKALRNGRRGLPGGSSLAKLLRRHGLK